MHLRQLGLTWDILSNLEKNLICGTPKKRKRGFFYSFAALRKDAASTRKTTPAIPLTSASESVCCCKKAALIGQLHEPFGVITFYWSNPAGHTNITWLISCILSFGICASFSTRQHGNFLVLAFLMSMPNGTCQAVPLQGFDYRRGILGQVWKQP